MPKYTISADYVDTCLSCYLQDSHCRPGEWLLSVTPRGQTDEEAAQELLDQMNGEAPPEDWPDEITDEQIKAAFREALTGVDLRFIDNGGNPVDVEDMTDEHTYEDENPYVYVVLRWEEGEGEGEGDAAYFKLSDELKRLNAMSPEELQSYLVSDDK